MSPFEAAWCYRCLVREVWVHWQPSIFGKLTVVHKLDAYSALTAARDSMNRSILIQKHSRDLREMQISSVSMEVVHPEAPTFFLLLIADRHYHLNVHEVSEIPFFTVYCSSDHFFFLIGKRCRSPRSPTLFWLIAGSNHSSSLLISNSLSVICVKDMSCNSRLFFQPIHLWYDRVIGVLLAFHWQNVCVLNYQSPMIRVCTWSLALIMGSRMLEHLLKPLVANWLFKAEAVDFGARLTLRGSRVVYRLHVVSASS